MNNSQFVFFLAARLGCSPETAEQYITTIVKWLGNTVVDSGELIIRDFGKFVVEKRNEHIVIDADTKKRTLIPPQLLMRFVAYPLLDEEEKGGYVAMEKVASVVAGQLKIASNVSEKAVMEFFKALLHVMNNDGEVAISGLGEFQLTKMQVGNHVYGKVTFRPDETLAGLVNRPFSYFQPVALHEGVTFDDTEVLSDDDDPAITADTFVIKTVDEAENMAETPSQTPESTLEKTESDESEKLEKLDDSESSEFSESSESSESSEYSEYSEYSESSENSETTNDASAVDIPVPAPASDVVAPIVPATANPDAPIEEPAPPTKRNFTGLAVLLGVVAIIGLVIFFFNHTGEEEENAVASNVSLTADSALVAENDSISTTSALPENEASDTIDFDAMNAQIPYGAYDIVAIDTVITVGKGQTALSISKMMLGTEYTIYIVVANDGNDQPQPGQPYRIPKLQLRSKK